MKNIIIILVFMVSSLQAQIVIKGNTTISGNISFITDIATPPPVVFTVDTSHQVWLASSSYNPLGNPRNQIWLLEDSGHVAMTLLGEGAGRGFQLFYDVSTTETDHFAIPNTKDHLHMNVWKDTIYIGNNDGTTAPTPMSNYTFVDKGASLYLDTIGNDTLVLGGYIGAVFPITKLPFSDSIIAVSQYDAGTLDSGRGANNSSVVSGDNGNTWGDFVEIRDDSAYGGSIRAGAFSSDSAVHAVFWIEAIDSIVTYQRRVNSAWAYDGGIGADSLSRGFCYSYDEDSQYIWLASINNQDKDSLYIHYGYKTMGGSSWYQDSVYVGRGYASTANNFGSVGLTYLQSGNKMICTYICFNNDAQSDDSTVIKAMEYDYPNQSWSDPIIISDGFNCMNAAAPSTPTLPPYIPASWGNQYYILYESTVGGNDYLRLTNIKVDQ